MQIWKFTFHLKGNFLQVTFHGLLGDQNSWLTMCHNPGNFLCKYSCKWWNTLIKTCFIYEWWGNNRHEMIYLILWVAYNYVMYIFSIHFEHEYFWKIFLSKLKTFYLHCNFRLEMIRWFVFVQKCKISSFFYSLNSNQSFLS